MLMLAGAAAVLCALVLLWHSTRSEVVLATSPVSAGDAAPASTPPLSSSAVLARNSPPAASTNAPAAPRAAHGERAPILAPEPPPHADGPAPLTNENLQFGAPQLHAQNVAVEPLVRECVDNAIAGGQHPTGTAQLTYIVAKHGDKYEIEDTGVDYDNTTLKEDKLLDCLHQTAKAMHFEGLPRGAQALTVTRSVTLENGTITEYKHLKFSYLR
jgi:hypothetical protein